MATLVLGAVGSSLGAGFGGSILGMSGSVIGGMLGSMAGAAVDSWIIASLTPGQRYEGSRLDSLRITSSTEGVVIPRVFGTMRVGGNVIWATDFREEVSKTRQGGKGGGGSSVTTTEYTYYASFAVALCEGPITGIGRVWADGELLDMSDVEWRWYPGDEVQEPDSLIESFMGAGSTPAYRGTAYVVLDDMLLTEFGNRIPQMTFEVFRPLADADAAEGMVQAVTLIPATGEFAYGSTIVESSSEYVNQNALAGRSDASVALDYLEALVPSVKSVSVVVGWFGSDLRAGNCTIRPGVETQNRSTTPLTWRVNGVSRGSAHLVTYIDGKPAYGGTPSDATIVETIQSLKARGYRVTFYPFLLMDVAPDNSLPNPYSDNAAEAGQAVFPWRGRITCSPSTGYAGSVDKTATAAAQVASFFGAAQASNFSVSGTTVSWTGGTDWGWRRMILHYAHLCAAAGGVDSFLIGSEMRGLTQIRSDAGTYPAVAQFQSLAAAVRSILGAGTKLGYAADWSEYFGHHPGDGSGDAYFHLDPIWADPNIDFVGIDNYMPLSDWRDGFDHLDAQAGAMSIYDADYLRSNIEGGEGFDWYYASDADRAGQIRTPVSDGAAGKPWVFRYKDIRAWWSNLHYNRPGGSESGTATGWVPQSKPIRFTELGCPAIDRGTNQPNVFHDPKSSESMVPYFSRAWRDDRIQRCYLEAVYGYWAEPANNPVSSVYGGSMLDLGECAAWTWDVRPYPFFPNLTDVWADGENWRLGHWLNGRLGSVSLRALVRHLCLASGLAPERIDVSDLSGAVEGIAITALESPVTSITVLARHFGFDACETQGVIRFAMRGRAPVMSLTVDDLVGSSESSSGDVMEITRAQETELPLSLKWQMTRNDDEYDAIVVEASRVTVDSSRISSETFSLVASPEEGERRVRRALMETWTGRETGTFALPPSRIALDPADVITLRHDGRDYEFRLTAVSDAESRSIETIRQDREVYDLPPGIERSNSTRRITFYPAPTVVMMNLPQIAETYDASYPLMAVTVDPWPGPMAIYRSEDGLDDYQLVSTFSTRARMGVLGSDLYAGPVDRLDLANEIYVNMDYGEITSVSDTSMFAGANAFAIETSAGVWEIVQAANADLIGSGQYRLTRLLRGVRGTEDAMVPVIAAGARFVALDEALVPVAVQSSEIGGPASWRVGPAAKAVSTTSYTQIAFTPTGRGLEPFSGVHAAQPWRRGRTTGDLVISWIRRSRSLSADLWSAGEVPVDDVPESYELDVMDGAVVKRTLSGLTGPQAVYTAADQIADFGAPLGPGSSLSVRIYQIAPLVGRGIPLTETLYF